jgi:hypothetical protein
VSPGASWLVDKGKTQPFLNRHAGRLVSQMNGMSCVNYLLSDDPDRRTNTSLEFAKADLHSILDALFEGISVQWGRPFSVMIQVQPVDQARALRKISRSRRSMISVRQGFDVESRPSMGT